MNSEIENTTGDSNNDELPIDYFNEGVDINLMDTIDLTDAISTIGDDLSE